MFDVHSKVDKIMIKCLNHLNLFPIIYILNLYYYIISNLKNNIAIQAARRGGGRDKNPYDFISAM